MAIRPDGVHLMSRLQPYRAMLRYHLHQPLRTWALLIVLTTQSVFMGWLFNFLLWQQESSGLEPSMGYMGVMFSVIMMISFVGGSIGASTSWAWILPHAEFLLSRPVRRRPVFLPLLLLCFCILLVCPVLNIFWTLPHPDLLLSLYHGGTQSTEASRDLAIYRHAFPASSVVQLPRQNHLTLRIPWGATLEALWSLWQTVLLGMIIEGATLLQMPSFTQRRLVTVLACIPAGIILAWRWIGPHLAIEKIFFFFAQHLALIVLATLVGFIWLQWQVWNRIEQVEVN
jgi:hypothetical protein